MLFLNGSRPGSITPGFPLRAILVPKVSGVRESKLVPLSQAQTVAALAPSTILQLPGAGQAALGRMVRVASGVAGYLLEAGTDLAHLAEVVRSALRDDAGAGR